MRPVPPGQQLAAACGVAGIFAGAFLATFESSTVVRAVLGTLLIASLLWSVMAYRKSEAAKTLQSHANEERRLAARRLFELAEEGVHHVQNIPQRDEKVAWTQFAQWEQLVLATMADAGCTEADQSEFRVLGTYQSRGLGGKTPLFEKLREESAEKIARLRAIARNVEGADASEAASRRMDLSTTPTTFRVAIEFTLLHLRNPAEIAVGIRISNRSKSDRLALEFFLFQSDQPREYWSQVTPHGSLPTKVSLDAQSETQGTLVFQRERAGRANQELPKIEAERLVLRISERISERWKEMPPNESVEWT